MDYQKSRKLAGLAGSKNANWCPEDSLVASNYQRVHTRTTHLISPSVTWMIWLNVPSGELWKVVHQEKSLTHHVAELQGSRETLDLGNMSCKVVYLECGNPLHQCRWELSGWETAKLPSSQQSACSRRNHMPLGWAWTTGWWNYLCLALWGFTWNTVPDLISPVRERYWDTE